MKVLRTRRARTVAVIVGIAVVLAGPAYAIACNVGAGDNDHDHDDHHGLTSEAGAAFSITSNVYDSPVCSGATALLYPSVVRCAVFTVQNNLSVPISVQSITTTLDATFPPPPSICASSYLTLPAFSGSFTVPADGSANSPGVVIELQDSGTNQDVCENFTYHFVYDGTAVYTDTTTTSLSSSPNPSLSGQYVTFTATVTAANLGVDSHGPSGTVNFYSCPTASCGSTNLLGTGAVDPFDGKATFSTSSLPVGTTYVEAVYEGSGTDFSASPPSNVVTQVVLSSAATTTALSSFPDPSLLGQSVTLKATVSSGAGTPAGSVAFYVGTPTGPHTLIGTAPTSSGLATLATSTLPAGSDSVYAVYSGGGGFASSTSPVVVQLVLGPPPPCPSGSYDNFVIGVPFFPIVFGTNGNDFIDAVNGNFIVSGFEGNDCIWAGDGVNLLTDGNGNDVVVAGNGLNTVALGNGNDKVVVGNGSNAIAAGNGNDSVTAGSGDFDQVLLFNGNDSVSVGNGSHDNVVVGNGTDTVNVGSGSHDTVTLGTGPDTVTIQSPGSYDTIFGGNGNETVYLGSGTNNTYDGEAHRTDVCHLPAPPPSWVGTTAAYYHDTIVNCTVVSP